MVMQSINNDHVQSDILVTGHNLCGRGSQIARWHGSPVQWLIFPATASLRCFSLQPPSEGQHQPTSSIDVPVCCWNIRLLCLILTSHSAICYPQHDYNTAMVSGFCIFLDHRLSRELVTPKISAGPSQVLTGNLFDHDLLMVPMLLAPKLQLPAELSVTRIALTPHYNRLRSWPSCRFNCLATDTSLSDQLL